jgi:hypothetical protein
MKDLKGDNILKNNRREEERGNTNDVDGIIGDLDTSHMFR